jgi:hypothetical protein
MCGGILAGDVLSAEADDDSQFELEVQLLAIARPVVSGVSRCEIDPERTSLCGCSAHPSFFNGDILRVFQIRFLAILLNNSAIGQPGRSSRAIIAAAVQN